MSGRRDLRPGQMLLLLFGALLFGGSALLYFSSTATLKRYLGWPTEEGAGESSPVGHLESRHGDVLRQLKSESEFRALLENAPLYNADTVVTGADGTAKVLLDDGSSIDLEPNTMIKLAFESRLSLEGISRLKVEIVTGEVSGRAKSGRVVLKTRDREVQLSKTKVEAVRFSPPAQPPVRVVPTPVPTPIIKPTPTPSPTPPPEPVRRVVLRAPAPDGHLVLMTDKHGMGTVHFDWTTEPQDLDALLMVRRPGGKAPLVSKLVRAVRGSASFVSQVASEGRYEWELFQVSAAGQQTSLAKAPFSVELVPSSLDLLQPSFDGGTATFQWKQHPKAVTYRLAISRDPKVTSPFYEKTVNGTKSSFRTPKALAGTFYGQVNAKLKSGMTVSSQILPFTFPFLPPKPFLPANKSSMAEKFIAQKGHHVILTWQTLDLSDRYEVELAADEKFSQRIFLNETVTNFMVLESLKAGHYWWRVRGRSAEVSSDFSNVFEFLVTP